MRGVEFNPCDEAGFTLIEVLAALSVFAIAALGLIHVSSENTHGARAIEERMLATIVADNEMTLTLVQRTPLEVGVSTGRTVVGGRDWEWRKIISTTPNPLIQQVKIEAWVYDEGFEGEQSVNVSLTAFKGKTS